MRPTHFALPLVLGLHLSASAAPPLQDPDRDPLRLYPENYRILFENEHVRVLDFRLARGASESTHEHPRHVAVFLTDVKIRFTLPDGSQRLREARSGDVAYSEPTAHASENIGPAEAHGVLIELRTPAPGALIAPALIDADARPPERAPGQITAVTLIHGLPGMEAGLKQHLLSLSAPTRAEPGCLRYDLYQSTVNPHEFMRLEVWSSIDALEAHKRTPHLRASFERRQREGWTTEILTFQRAE